MKTLILAGGGHGHINILKELILRPLKNINILLISDYKRQYYSGMLPGYLDGKYSEDDISFDVLKLCKMANVSFIEEKIQVIDDKKKVVKTEKNSYSYDFLSLNLGGVSKKYECQSNNFSSTKPIYELISFFKKNHSNFSNGASLSIIGGGASGVEIAVSLKSAYSKLNINLYSKGSDLIPSFNDKSKNFLYEYFRHNGISFYTGYEFISYKDNVIEFRSNDLIKKIHSDFVIISSGITGANLEFIGIETDDNNFVLTDQYLLVNNHTLAMGDMIEFDNKNLPKAGVFAIHMAPILFHNLLEIIEERSNFKRFIPNKNYLQILNMGNKTGLLNYGDISLKGRFTFLLKDYIDKKYMKIRQS